MLFQVLIKKTYIHLYKCILFLANVSILHCFSFLIFSVHPHPSNFVAAIFLTGEFLLRQKIFHLWIFLEIVRIIDFPVNLRSALLGKILSLCYMFLTMKKWQYLLLKRCIMYGHENRLCWVCLSKLHVMWRWQFECKLFKRLWNCCLMSKHLTQESA